MYIHSGSKETTSLNTPLASLNDLSGMNGMSYCKNHKDPYSPVNVCKPNHKIC